MVNQVRYRAFCLHLCLLAIALLQGCSIDGGSFLKQVDNNPVITSARPNVLVIVVDDLGYNDLGVFGGEIDTPNIDSLAGKGVILTNFHASPTCSPTRAMLMSGTDNHIAGLGSMSGLMSPNQIGKPGYEGYLNFRVAALPELFQDAGYNTYMTGKWHLGLTEETSPAARGFDKSFALLQGGAGHFSNMLPLIGGKNNKALYREGRQLREQLPEDFYATRFYTERLIQYIDDNKDNGKPFFAYLAHTVPHWPLQAPRESIAKYKGKYDAGYDALRESRLARAKELGLLEDDVSPFPRLLTEKTWDELSEAEKKYQARLMEIYAAMVDDLDVYTGKLIDYLKATGQYDNTLIFFMSDNGAEGHNFNENAIIGRWANSCCDNSLENIGNADSYAWYGPNWALAGSAPMRMYKGDTGQGGIRVPAFFHFPEGINSNKRIDELSHVKDVLPTLLDMVGIEHPGQGKFRGRTVEPIQGHSVVPLLKGETKQIHAEDDYVGWELFGKRAIRKGDWKIIYIPYHERRTSKLPLIKMDTWQLYNLAEDPSEMNDLAEQYPEKLAEMVALWDEYASSNGVIIPDIPNSF